MRRLVAYAAFAIPVGWLLYWLSCQLVPPSEVVGDGFDGDWQWMSVDPFALHGRLPHRILVPFLAWLFGYGGEGYLEFTHGLHVLLLATVVFIVLRMRGKLVDAVLVGGVVAITAPTQMYKLHWNGYTDPACYTLFLWMVVAARQPYVFWSLFFVNLMNHELAIFFVPWLWFLRRQQDARWRLDLVCLAIAGALYGAFYLWVKVTAEPMFSADYFLSHPLFPGGTFAVWNLAAVHLTCTFGPVLALLAWHQSTVSRTSEVWHLRLVLAAIAVIFCIAFDWARHSNLIVLPLVFACTRFVAVGNGHRVMLVGVIAVALLLFWWVPPWTSSAWPTNVLANNAFATGVARVGPGPGLDITFGPVSAAFGKWLPAVWPTLVVVHAIGLSFCAIGWAWARHGRNRERN